MDGVWGWRLVGWIWDYDIHVIFQIKGNLHENGLKNSVAAQGVLGPLRGPSPWSFPAYVSGGVGVLSGWQ